MTRKRSIARISLDAEEYLKNKEYLKAKSELSLILNKTDNEIIREHSHFIRAIANFHLKKFHNKNGFFVDLKAVSDNFKRNFLFLLDITPENYAYDNALIVIENIFDENPYLLSQYKNLLIHLPLEFQIISKIRFN